MTLPVYVRRLGAVAFIAMPLGSMLPGEAAAEETITFEPRATLIVPKSVYPGVGLAVNGGISLNLEPVILEPELSLVGDGFPSLKGGTFRAMAGARVGLALAVEPVIFTHVGYGFLDIAPNLVHACSFDIGFELDYRVKRSFKFGGAIGYELLGNGQGVTNGAFFGPRLTVVIE